MLSLVAVTFLFKQTNKKVLSFLNKRKDKKRNQNLNLKLDNLKWLWSLYTIITCWGGDQQHCGTFGSVHYEIKWCFQEVTSS